MQLQIVGVNQKELFNVSWVELQTKVGNFIIQPEHAPMILELQSNSQIRFCLDNSKQAVFEISTGGFAHITRQNVTILINNNL